MPLLKKFSTESKQNDITLLNAGNLICQIRIPDIESNQKQQKQYQRCVRKTSNPANHDESKTLQIYKISHK